MKTKHILSAAAAIIVMFGVSSCAELGMGVDVDSYNTGPYWYGNGYLGGTYWNTPVWDYGPIYRPRPPRPPMINVEPGPVILPDSRPVPSEGISVSPGINGVRPGNVAGSIGGIQRPGNGGLPTQNVSPSPRPAANR